MKEFLANIRPPKFLRYLFFIGYSWYRSFKSEREDAHTIAIILLWAVHFFTFISLSSTDMVVQENIDFIAHFFCSVVIIGYLIYFKKKITNKGETN